MKYIITFLLGLILGLLLRPHLSSLVGNYSRTSVSSGSTMGQTCGVSSSTGGGCQIGSSQPPASSIAHSGVFVQGHLTRTQDFIGKPSLLRRAGKYCAYCREKIKPAEILILDAFSGQINIQLFTMNFDSQKFDTRIPQVPFETLSYESYTKQTCDTFPTWVVLDAQGQLVSQECGGTGTIEGVVQTLQKLLP